jgi:hypothetical protein
MFLRLDLLMKWYRLPMVVCFAGLSAALAEPAADEGSGLKTAEDLVRQLADESFHVREEAGLKLWQLGDAALPALEAAAASTDPEQAIRADDILRKIRLHITPDTDPSVIHLVEQYASASPAEKAALMGKLRGKRAWWQMLKLYAVEKHPEVRERLESSMGTVALRAARERILQGDGEGAREFLELGPANAAGLRALAEFHRSHGSLDAELERAAAIQGAKGAAWRMALHCAAGNLTAARDEALAAGDPEFAAILSAMAGDPLPALEIAARDDAGDPVRAAYARIAIKRWQDQKIRQSDLDFLRRAVVSRDPSESGGALTALFLAGESELALAALTKSQPLAAFRHLDAMERIPEALRAIGLDPENPDYKTWVAKRFPKVLDHDIEDQHAVSDEVSEVWALANFMERRGLHAQALEAFGGVMAALAEKDSHAFLELLSKLFGDRSTLAGAPRLARALALPWAGDDANRWEDIIVAAFGDNDTSMTWWNWLGEVKPEAPGVERLDVMLALFGLSPDPEGLCAKWLPLLWQAVDAEAPAGDGILADRIHDMATTTGDVTTAMKAWEKLPAARREKVFFGQMLIHFSALERWDDAADLMLRQVAMVRDAGQEPGADLHAYTAASLRMAGREEQAADHDSWVEKLALGNAAVAQRIGNGYAFGRDYTRAALWWRRAVLQSASNSEELATALKFHTDQLLETQAWPETAALSEYMALSYTGSNYLFHNHLPLLRLRLQSDTARALAGLSRNRERSIALLGLCHRQFASDGSLADFFFPGIRAAGLIQQHDQWFRESWRHFEDVIRRYPDADNTRNTAAWFASRAMRELTAAEKHIRRALELNPRQSAYLDTMAEIHFARHHRAKALEWSQLAINYTPEDVLLRRQHERFRSGPFPK